jgi:hypothetical protein
MTTGHTGDQPDNKAGLTQDATRDGKGRFDRDPKTVARDAQAAGLRAQSKTYQQIADELGISKQSAYEAVHRALADTLEEPAAALRTLELEKLDAIERRYLEIIERRHAVLYQGEDTGYDDDGPTVQAQAGLLRVSESRRKLLGLDSPVKVDVSGGVKYEIVGVTEADLT